MLTVGPLILPLIIVLFIVIVLVVFLLFYNKNLVQKINTSISEDYTSYKDELKKQNDALTKQLLKQLAEQHANIINARDAESGKNLLNVFGNLKEAIKENCITAMNQIKAARIGVYLFHNGTHSSHGISFLKVSCMCEKVAIGSGIRERMMEHTNVPINLFDDMIDTLITNNRFIIMNDDQLQELSHRMFVSADKIKYSQLIALYDINNNMLGFICAEMNKPYSKDEADKEKEVLDELAKQLVPVLSYSDYTLLKTH